jgi:tRNA threonylcarbamoyl adenosine modification protein YeaZ
MVEKLSLCINTALRKTEIALVSKDIVIGEKSWASENDEAETLMPSIDKLLNSKKINYEDLGEVIVVSGPGSFTGLRIGVTAANVISYLQKIPVFGITTFNFLRARNDYKKDVIMLFAGKSEVYLQMKKNGKPELFKTEDAISFLKEKKIKKVCAELLTSKKNKTTFGKTILKIDKKDLKKASVIEPYYIKGPGISKPKPIK